MHVFCMCRTAKKIEGLSQANLSPVRPILSLFETWVFELHLMVLKRSLLPPGSAWGVLL